MMNEEWEKCVCVCWLGGGGVCSGWCVKEGGSRNGLYLQCVNIFEDVQYMHHPKCLPDNWIVGVHPTKFVSLDHSTRHACGDVWKRLGVKFLSQALFFCLSNVTCTLRKLQLYADEGNKLDFFQTSCNHLNWISISINQCKFTQNYRPRLYDC